jgi:hypothetical protein
MITKPLSAKADNGSRQKDKNEIEATFESFARGMSTRHIMRRRIHTYRIQV